MSVRLLHIRMMDEPLEIRIPHSLKRAVEEFAQKDGLSLNQFFVLALASRLGRVGAEDVFPERGIGADAKRKIEFPKGRVG